MPKFTGIPPDSEGRKAIEKRAREATRPAEPEKPGCWPFSANKTPFAIDPSARQEGSEKPG